MLRVRLQTLDWVSTMPPEEIAGARAGLVTALDDLGIPPIDDENPLELESDDPKVRNKAPRVLSEETRRRMSEGQRKARAARRAAEAAQAA